MPDTPILTADKVSKSFGDQPALREISIRVRAGEIVAVTGASGSGKSTLLHCLAGILRPDAGEIRFDGAALPADDRKLCALRRTRFGFVFQFGQLVPELTCAENVALPLRLQKVGGRAARAAAHVWLDRLDVGRLGKKRPGELSGGEGQRVAIARALVTQPRVIFADEPTGALDSLNGEKVMMLLTEAARTSRTAVVLVTHDARVAAYRDGRITTMQDSSL
jgi:putative ABC transport system ATP-binding protein